MELSTFIPFRIQIKTILVIKLTGKKNIASPVTGQGSIFRWEGIWGRRWCVFSSKPVPLILMFFPLLLFCFLFLSSPCGFNLRRFKEKNLRISFIHANCGSCARYYLQGGAKAIDYTARNLSPCGNTLSAQNLERPARILCI